MRRTIEIGKDEKHVIEAYYNPYFCRGILICDGVGFFAFSGYFPFRQSVTVGKNEKHKITIQYSFKEMLRNTVKFIEDGVEIQSKSLDEPQTPLWLFILFLMVLFFVTSLILVSTACFLYKHDPSWPFILSASGIFLLASILSFLKLKAVDAEAKEKFKGSPIIG
jgi:hypothetical protein